jgi:hypothetical protein
MISKGLKKAVESQLFNFILKKMYFLTLILINVLEIRKTTHYKARNLYFNDLNFITVILAIRIYELNDKGVKVVRQSAKRQSAKSLIGWRQSAKRQFAK